MALHIFTYAVKYEGSPIQPIEFHWQICDHNCTGDCPSADYAMFGTRSYPSHDTAREAANSIQSVTYHDRTHPVDPSLRPYKGKA